MPIPPNVILIGFMGSGKTTTGKQLSKIMRFRFLDMDRWIERKNKKTVRNIFKEKGEGYFRKEEKRAIRWLNSRNHYVISTGGGVWLDRENREKLLKMGMCVWLKVSAEEAFKRINPRLTKRPLLAGAKNPILKIKSLLRKRDPYYSLAHQRIDTKGKSPRVVALETANLFNAEGRLKNKT